MVCIREELMVNDVVKKSQCARKLAVSSRATAVQ